MKKASNAAALDEALKGDTLPSPIWVATDEPLLQVEYGDRVRARAEVGRGKAVDGPGQAPAEAVEDKEQGRGHDPLAGR